MLKIAQYILGAALIFGPAAASAGDLVPDAADGIMNSCRPDYHRICSNVAPGNGRVARCLLNHQAEISPYCQQAIKIASAVEDCMPDYQRLCPGVAKGQQAFQCLADRIDMLMPACRRVVSANAPYMRRDERYGYNGGYNANPAPYASPAPYSSPAPYAGPNPGAYASQDGYARPSEPQQPYNGYAGPGAPQSQPYNGYAGPGAPQGQAYNGYAYPGDPRTGPQYDGYAYRNEQPREPYDGYAYQPNPGPGYTGRYAEQGEPRFRSYDDNYSGGYAGPGYGGAPRAPY